MTSVRASFTATLIRCRPALARLFLRVASPAGLRQRLQPASCGTRRLNPPQTPSSPLPRRGNRGSCNSRSAGRPLALALRHFLRLGSPSVRSSPGQRSHTCHAAAPPPPHHPSSTCCCTAASQRLVQLFLDTDLRFTTPIPHIPRPPVAKPAHHNSASGRVLCSRAWTAIEKDEIARRKAHGRPAIRQVCSRKGSGSEVSGAAMSRHARRRVSQSTEACLGAAGR